MGAYSVGMVPWGTASTNKAELEKSGLNAGQMLGLGTSEDEQPCNAYILLNIEPELDCHDARRALQVMDRAEFVVSLSSYKGNIPSYADVILPISPFTETSGTFVNSEGRIQSFQGVVSPLGETRPAWKILRVLGNLLQLEGFDYDSSEQIRMEIVSDKEEFVQNLDNSLSTLSVGDGDQQGGKIERIGEVPIYQADPIVRRAMSLQKRMMLLSQSHLPLRPYLIK